MVYPSGAGANFPELMRRIKKKTSHSLGEEVVSAESVKAALASFERSDLEAMKTSMAKWEKGL